MSYEAAVTKLEDALYGLITDTLNLPIYFRNASNQRPSTKHIQLYINSITENGDYVKEALDTTNKRSTWKEYEVSVDVGCNSGRNTQASLLTLVHTISSFSGLYNKYFVDEGIAYLRSSSITRRDFPLDKIQWEERSVVTMIFNVMVELKETEGSGFIETVEIPELTVIRSDNNKIIEQDIITYTDSIPME